MSKISCFIVEDDPQALSYASAIITKYTAIDIHIIGNSDSIHEAAEQIKRLEPDFIILDVFLTDGNAFEFLSLFDEINFKIIFTTSYAKYAIEAFKFSALDYILKPYEQNELIVALEKVKEDIHKENYQHQLQTLLHNFANQEEPKKIVLKTADTVHIVNIKDILYAKSDNNYTIFVLNNSKEILVSKPLKSFDEKLTNHKFLRIHQSFLINLYYISSFNKREDKVILAQSHAIPVSQSKKKILIEYINTIS
ncbi:LytR/AlgR family response regulator transcription factor [Aquimarina algicola]|uniref:Response regulator transcription factor n=1 Tax=Aquimarina algicola TaxID=2589995 RepID=A0A504JCY5_9FLAO|nr:LytTR family DNA-binding domain-containing protein [Aquimarina algicola]TPN88727.1 response regulator transcription factor [Aquimarina algicola]